MRNEIICITAALMALLIRYTAVKFFKSRKFSIRLAAGIGLFLQYNILLYLFLTFLSQNVITQGLNTQEGYPFIKIALLAFNAAALFVGIIFSVVYGKRSQLS